MGRFGLRCACMARQRRSRTYGRLTAVVLGVCLAVGSSAGRADTSADRPAPSAADKRAAARAFAEGRRAFQLGDYRHAAESFEQAYRLAPHHAPLWNAARAWHRAGNLVRAANLYAKYLEEAPPRTPDRNTATAALEELRPQLGRLEVHAAGGVTDLKVDGEAWEGGTGFVTPGTHAIEGTYEGKPVHRSQEVAAGQMVSTTLEPPPPPAPPPPRPPPSPPPPTGWSPTVVYVGGAVTLAGVAFTTWSGLNTLSQKEAFDKEPTPANLDEGRSRQRRTNVALALTVGAAAFTTVAAVWLVDWKSPDKPGKGSVQIGAGPSSVTLRGSF